MSPTTHTLPELDYLCVGVCMTDPDSGYCLGCGRPPLPTTDAVVAEAIDTARARAAAGPCREGDPDSPCSAPAAAAGQT